MQKPHSPNYNASVAINKQNPETAIWLKYREISCKGKRFNTLDQYNIKVTNWTQRSNRK